MKLLLSILCLLLLLAMGSYCLFLPRRVQSLATRMVSTGVTSKSRWLKAFVQSNSYIINVRFVGVLAYITFLLVAFSLFTKP